MTGEQVLDEGTDFEQHRRYLSAVAYRLLGSLADAEDAVQDAWLRWQGVDRAAVQDPRAYLTTVVTRICYDQLGSARARREAYFGEWLPEPSVSAVDRAPGPEDAATLGESVSYAMLAVMEQLAPAERVAFVLHDVFAVEFGEIAKALDRTPESVRQLASRARRRVRPGVGAGAQSAGGTGAAANSAAEAGAGDAGGMGGAGGTGEPEPGNADLAWRRVDRAEHRKVVAAFAAATLHGDIPGLMAVLDPDVVWHSDGGGIVRAGKQPVLSAERVARLLGGFTKWIGPEAEVRLYEADVNGTPGLVILDGAGAAMGVIAFEIADGRIAQAYAMVNPEKLSRVADGAVSEQLPRRGSTSAQADDATD